jgi:ubiquinone/menaquinone biosynthesis C-methylase UbiE
MSERRFDQDPFIQALLTLHHGLPRGGPGSDRNTKKALGMLPGLPEKSRVIDLGCGPGKQTLVLAQELGVKITAVDIFAGFLDQLKTLAEKRGLTHLIEPMQADMTKLEYPPKSWDIIWCEGAMFIPGYKQGLNMYRPWLDDGGMLALTEATWLKPGAPQEVKEFWNACYPAIQDVEANLKVAREAGYEVLDTFTLEDEDWLEEYWAPMRLRLDGLEKSTEPDCSLAKAVAAARLEIGLFEKYSEYYGYVFYLLRAV